MPEVRGPGLKLFGRTIPLPEAQGEAAEKPSSPPVNVSVEDKFEGRCEGGPEEAGQDPPCPRCNSSNTKFCYYNNYNVNQPRHFCKNCQRYWTAGGTMRNVPVGAGRRKNKSTGLHSRHSGAVKPAVAVARPARSGDNAGEPSCASSSLTASTGLEGEFPDGEEQAAAVLHGADAGLPPPPPPPPVHCYPWPVGWNGASAAAAAAAVPFPLLPTFFWSCMSAWPASPAWAAAPWAGPASPAAVAPSSACAAAGKVAETSSIWVPKTLRIDDPDEAAKSSIWATLGINPDPRSAAAASLEASIPNPPPPPASPPETAALWKGSRSLTSTQPPSLARRPSRRAPKLPPPNPPAAVGDLQGMDLTPVSS
ncbi:unnamed protein product [Spirodela intermedia]|uniref:Dof-type domain-containing protein n=1 Tax=Spirodela intermedia TaxID=51605 RepID=A0A7I8IGI6_SPIIN|nr:unnamed protein product [Spirodela intermedia]CAA6656989.1 unnamed protein product [Spirodela intermedia]